MKPIEQEKKFAKILKSIKPIFENREGYGWQAALNTAVDCDGTNIVAIYEWKGKLFMVDDEAFDGTFSRLPYEIQEKCYTEVINWLKKLDNPKVNKLIANW